MNGQTQEGDILIKRKLVTAKIETVLMVLS